MENVLTKLIAQYNSLIKEIRNNRQTMRLAEGINKDRRKALKQIRADIYATIKPELKKGKTVYRIAQENFGKIDKRFHILYSIFLKKL